MIARAAETNPTCFSDKPLVDLDKTLVPSYFRLSKYLDNHWGLTKFCVAQFQGDRVNIKKAKSTKIRQMLSQAKAYDAITDLVGEWTGEDEMKQIIEAIEKNPPRLGRMYLPAADLTNNSVTNPASTSGNGVVASAVPSAVSAVSSEEDSAYATPQNIQNPESPSSGAPFLPKDFLSKEPLSSIADPGTPTPTHPQLQYESSSTN